MKAKLKDGRVLPIEKDSLIALDNNGDTLEVNVEDIDSFIDNNIDWAQVRIQAAIASMQGILSNSSNDDTIDNITRVSVELADALIEKLKNN